MREWSELEMSFLSPSDGYCSAEQQLQYYGESVLPLLSRCRFLFFLPRRVKLQSMFGGFLCRADAWIR